MNALRILVLASHSYPDSISTSLIGYAHSEALARLHAVTLVTFVATRRPCAVSRPPFLPWRPSVSRGSMHFAWCLRWIFKYNYGSQALTAFSYPFSLAFEWRAWRQMRARIMAGDFDVVLVSCR